MITKYLIVKLPHSQHNQQTFAMPQYVSCIFPNLELSVLKSDNKEVSGVAIKLDSKTLLMTK